MHVFHALQHLVNDVLFVDIFEDVSTDDGMQVGVHEVEDKVDVAIVFGANYILEPNNVLMAGQLLQKDDLAEGALGVSSILECVEVLLEGNNLFRPFVDRLPHDTIGSLSYEKTSTNDRSVVSQTIAITILLDLNSNFRLPTLHSAAMPCSCTEFSNLFSSKKRKLLLFIIC